MSDDNTTRKDDTLNDDHTRLTMKLGNHNLSCKDAKQILRHVHSYSPKKLEVQTDIEVFNVLSNLINEKGGPDAYLASLSDEDRMLYLPIHGLSFRDDDDDDNDDDNKTNNASDHSSTKKKKDKKRPSKKMPKDDSKKKPKKKQPEESDKHTKLKLDSREFLTNTERIKYLEERKTNSQLVKDMYDKYIPCIADSYLIPKEHQIEVVGRILNQRGLVVVQPTGSGKTLLMVLATQCVLRNVPNIDQVIMVVPASSIDAFKKTFIQYNISREDAKKYVIMSPRMFLNLYKNQDKYFSRTMLCIDECHVMRTANSQTAKTLYYYGSRAARVIMTTATLIWNSPEDAYTQLNTVRDEPIDIKRNAWKNLAESNPSSLAKYFKGYVSYIPPSTENFPQRIDNYIKCKMSPEYYKYYRGIEKNVLSVVGSGNLTPFYTGVRLVSNKVFEKQVSTDTSLSLVPGEEEKGDGKQSETEGLNKTQREKLNAIKLPPSDIDVHLLVNPKIEAIKNILAKQQQTIIYSNFNEAGIFLIRQTLRDMNIRFCEITGNVKVSGRQSVLEQYNAHEMWQLDKIYKQNDLVIVTDKSNTPMVYRSLKSNNRSHHPIDKDVDVSNSVVDVSSASSSSSSSSVRRSTTSKYWQLLGPKAQVLLLCKAGAVGLDTKGTRHLILMETFWSSSDRDQVIGRGIRFGSHGHLPIEERNVHVHHLTLSKPDVLDKDDEGSLSIDDYLTDMMRKKERTIQRFMAEAVIPSRIEDETNRLNEKDNYSIYVGRGSAAAGASAASGSGGVASWADDATDRHSSSSSSSSSSSISSGRHNSMSDRNDWKYDIKKDQLQPKPLLQNGHPSRSPPPKVSLPVPPVPPKSSSLSSSFSHHVPYTTKLTATKRITPPPIDLSSLLLPSSSSSSSSLLSSSAAAAASSSSFPYANISPSTFLEAEAKRYMLPSLLIGTNQGDYNAVSNKIHYILKKKFPENKSHRYIYYKSKQGNWVNYPLAVLNGYAPTITRTVPESDQTKCACWDYKDYSITYMRDNDVLCKIVLTENDLARLVTKFVSETKMYANTTTTTTHTSEDDYLCCCYLVKQMEPRDESATYIRQTSSKQEKTFGPNSVGKESQNEWKRYDRKKPIPTQKNCVYVDIMCLPSPSDTSNGGDSSTIVTFYYYGNDGSRQDLGMYPLQWYPNLTNVLELFIKFNIQSLEAIINM
jgi:superfamily II DNA/RNA helicase